MFCQTCPQKAFCSQLCPEAEAYVSQDHQTAREFFSFPGAKYIARPEPHQKFASLSKTEWKILALFKKGFTREEVCAILEISRPNLRVCLAKIKAKINASGALSD